MYWAVVSGGASISVLPVTFEEVTVSATGSDPYPGGSIGLFICHAGPAIPLA